MTELIESVDTLTAAVGELTKMSRSNRSRWRVTAPAVVLDVILSVGLAWSVAQINNQQHESARNTTIARLAACQQFNTQQRQQIDAEKAESHDFVAAITRGATDPTVSSRAAKFNREHDRLIVAGHQLRDCTPEGIAKYYAKKEG